MSARYVRKSGDRHAKRGVKALLSGEFLSPCGNETFRFSVGPIEASGIAPFSCGVKLYALERADFIIDSLVYGESAFQALELATALISDLSGWAEAMKRG